MWGSGLRKIEYVSDQNPRTIIRQLQPFRGPDPTRHPLWILHELNNFDKHRALHVVFAWVMTDLSHRGVFDIPDLPPGHRQARATQGPMYVADLPTGPVSFKVKMRGDLAMRVALPPQTVGSHECLDVVLAKILDFVETEVVEGLRGWIPLWTMY